jgi:hypothetical protein
MGPFEDKPIVKVTIPQKDNQPDFVIQGEVTGYQQGECKELKTVQFIVTQNGIWKKEQGTFTFAKEDLDGAIPLEHFTQETNA